MVTRFLHGNKVLHANEDFTLYCGLYKVMNECVTANPNWRDIFESSKLKARTSLLPRFSEKRRSSFEL